MSINPAIKVFTPDVSFLVIAFCNALPSIILNSIEIWLIWKKWRKASDFEVLLFYLAISDFMSAIGLLATASFLTFMYVTKSYSTFYLWVAFSLVGFFYMVSMKLVLIIGFERFFAIKLPLKHRLWHSNRKNLYRQICGAWILSAIIITAAVLSDYFMHTTKGHSATKGQSVTGQNSTFQNSTFHEVDNVEGQTATVSRNLGYALATYMSCGVLAILIIYTWVASFAVTRAAHLFRVDKKEYKRDPKLMKLAKKKERATVIICSMVLVAFLACNIPSIVSLYRGSLGHISAHLSNFYTIANPLIYFFKGYIERCYDKKKVVSSLNESEDRLEGTKSKSASQHTPIVTIHQLSSQPNPSHTAVEANIVENEGDDGQSMSIDQAQRWPWEKNRGASFYQSEVNTLEELGYVNVVEIVDSSKPTDQGVGMSKEKGEEASSEPTERRSSLDLGFVNTAASPEVPESNGEELEGSKNSGKRSLNMSESDTAL